MKVLDDGIESLTEISKQKDGMGLGHTQAKINIPDSPEDQFDQFPQRAPKKKNERGRPTNKRQKAGHEKLSKRPRFCSQCRSDKHTLQSCPSRDPATKKARKPPTCSGCRLTGHTVDRCIGYTDQQVAPGYMFL